MKTPSPTLQGLGAILHRPACGFAEIAWRWSFGLAAVLLLVSSAAEYLSTLTISAGDLLLLKTRHPVLVLQALARIFRGSAGRAVSAGIVLVLALALAWTVIASIGRASSLKSLLAYFRRRGLGSPPDPAMFPMVRSLVGLHFLRVAITFAAILASLGSLIISAARESRASAALIFWLMLTLIGLAWSGLNWLFSLAPVFVAAGAKHAFGSIAAAFDLYRERQWGFFAIETWFNLGHLVAFAFATFAVVAPFLLARRLSGLALVIAITSVFAYFAVVDFLYVGRLAAYLSMVLGPQLGPVASLPQVTPDSDRSGATSVDRDELILSDLPLPDGAG